MKTIRLISNGCLRMAAILAVYIFTQPALAECVQSNPPADLVFSIDANNGCDDIEGQAGCTIKNALGFCTYTDPGDPNMWFRVDSFLNPDGSLGWKLDANSTITGVDTAVVGGGSQGKNNCGYGYKFDVASGSGGDCKSYDANGNCTSFQNFTSLDVCTDGLTEEPPPPPLVAEKLPACQTDPSILGLLDDTGIKCPIEDDPGSPNYGMEKPVVVCNLEKDKLDWGATDGSDVCCQCGIPEDQQTECVVTEDRTQCAQSMTVNPTQSVEIIFFKDDQDPCTWIKTAQGWKQWCY